MKSSWSFFNALNDLRAVLATADSVQALFLKLLQVLQSGMDFLWSENATTPRASHFSVAICFAFASFAARFFLDRFVFRVRSLCLFALRKFFFPVALDSWLLLCQRFNSLIIKEKKKRNSLVLDCACFIDSPFQGSLKDTAETVGFISNSAQILRWSFFFLLFLAAFTLCLFSFLEIVQIG